MHTKTFSSNLQSLRELEEMGGAVEMLFLRHTLKIKPSGNNFQRGNVPTLAIHNFLIKRLLTILSIQVMCI